MTDCIFCAIIQDKLPAKKIYEDDLVLAFLDNRPVQRGHTMVIPKIHVDHFIDLEDDLLMHICKIGKMIGQRIQQTLNPIRVGFVVSGFGVPHAHYHVIPMWDEHDITSSCHAVIKNGNITFTMDHIAIADDDELNDMADLLKKDGW